MKDIDEYLRNSKTPELDFVKLMEGARVVKKKSTPGDLHKSQAQPSDGSYLSRFKDFEVLGELSDKRLAFWSRIKRKIYLTSLRDFNLDALDQIAGDECRWHVVRSAKELKDGKVHFFALKRDIIIQAGKTLLGEEQWLGQGINLLEDGRLLILCGDKAALWDGKQFEEFDGPMIEKKFISRNPAERWIDLGLLKKAVLDMNVARAKEIIQDAIRLIRQWRFLGPFDEQLIAGFLLAQMIQTVWEWRPHLWVSGSAGTGKTLLITLFDRIAGKLSRRYEGQTLTEPGFRQDLKSDFRLSQIDELERSDSRQELLALLRSAGRGGSSTKGTSSGKAVHYSIRHMILLCSIERGFLRAAEGHRFIRVETDPDPERNPGIPSREKADELRINFMAFALWASFRAKKIIGELGRIGNYEPRLVEAFAVPLSMICIADPDPLDSLGKATLLTLDEQRDSGDGETLKDEFNVLETILTSTVRVPVTDESERSVYSDRSISQMLQERSDFGMNTLQAKGIKPCADGLFLVPPIIERKLLKDSIWKGFDTQGILKRLPGAENTRRRVGGKNMRGILLTEWDMQIKNLGNVSQQSLL